MKNQRTTWTILSALLLMGAAASVAQTKDEGSQSTEVLQVRLGIFMHLLGKIGESTFLLLVHKGTIADEIRRKSYLTKEK